MQEAAHVLVVDDDSRLRELLTRYLRREGFRVSAAHGAAMARRLLSGLSFDLMVVDVMMPGEDGLSLTRAVRKGWSVPVLLLTARGESDDRIRGLEAGADDYLTKPFEPRELVLRARAILRRAPAAVEAETGPLGISLGPLRFDIERGELWRDEEPIHLTAGEAATLRILARHRGEPVSRADLLTTAASESDTGAQERAVDVQITRLRRKIEENPRSPRYLQTVRGAGYRLVPD